LERIGKLSLPLIFEGQLRNIRPESQLKEGHQGQCDDEQEGKNPECSAVPQPPPENDEKIWQSSQHHREHDCWWGQIRGPFWDKDRASRGEGSGKWT